ncbi:hypothetical protein POV27_15520 [Aureisphaera galaxeae]|uniref:tetratricopeptide repeat protein n=1 Tax=Aureisphaera galaxeae TaxID=1538023 RepID=UPI00234FB97B|nr:hypothetical protein [Aureisphaera galaxeae]MDC8005467.1 hypothetical protein [Aureisphaera galaxeae]
MNKYLTLLLCVSLLGCNSPKKETQQEEAQPITLDSAWEHDYQAISQLGDTLYPRKASEKMLSQLEEKKAAFDSLPSLDNLIWYGRFTAYTGDYRKAIDIYTHGLEKFPHESRLLRHRGHRYITVREFDKAIADLEKAVELIQDKENMIEEDGLPNQYNIPVSTMHGNIYYHLGLAYYLNRNLPKALDAYKECLSTSRNPDNVVSATHWVYMIQRRLARNQAADSYLKIIHPEMKVLENTSYYQACLFYKGELELDDIYPTTGDNSPSNSAIQYAIGNWYWYNGNAEQAEGIYRTLLANEDWAGFGFIAAETDLAKPYNMR